MHFQPARQHELPSWIGDTGHVLANTTGSLLIELRFRVTVPSNLDSVVSSEEG
jgi:hypothetical protein